MKKNKLFVLSSLSMLTLPFISGCGGSSKKEFTVTWLNYDGTVLEVDEKVAKGTMPSFDGATPIKDLKDENIYVHTGWDKELVEVKKDVTYTAIYETKSTSALVETPDGYIDVLPDDIGDSPIFHAFCWNFQDIITNLQTIKDAGFKSIQISPVQEPKGGGSTWWSYYQPISFTIAKNSSLGTKEDLIELCEKADQLGMDIIADIVFNHLANISDDELEADGTPKVSPEVANYEPEIYNQRNASSNPTFHHNPNAQGSGAVTQYYAYGKLPDLNTANELVQQRSLALLKECIDAGIDGFRFDAAKHIETPDDPQYPSDFWVNTLMEAKQYYKSLYPNKNLFAYGEILGEPGGNRKIDCYTKYMNVTDDAIISSINNVHSKADPSKAVNATYTKSCDASQLVTWVESHDTYIDSTNPMKPERLLKNFAILNTLKDSRALYLSRPSESLTVGEIGDYAFESDVLGAINRFHNRFAHADEYRSGYGKAYINQKVDGNNKGAIIVNLLKNEKQVAVYIDKLGSGIYYDQISGKEVKVVDGYALLDLSVSDIVILTMSKNEARPYLEVSSHGEMFVESMDVSVSYKNASSATYSINGGAEQPLANDSKIRLGDVVDEDNKIRLQITLGNGQVEIKRSFVFEKISLIEGYFNVLNLKEEYLTDYELYIWGWQPSNWNKNYEYRDGVLLVDVSNYSIGFLLAIFEKGHKISNPNAWDSAAIKQSADIKGADLAAGFFDASKF